MMAVFMFSPSGGQALELKLSLINTPVAGYRAAPSADSSSFTKSIALGEPVYVRLELANNAAQGIELLPSVDPADGFVRFFLVSGDTLDGNFTTLRWETRDSYLRPRELAPGERLVHETFLFGKFPSLSNTAALEYIFPGAGTYQLYAQYACPNPPVEVVSNRVTVVVGPPVAQWDKLQEAGIVNRLEGRRLPPAFEIQQTQMLNEIIGPAAGSPYAPWFLDRPAAGSEKVVAALPASQEEMLAIVADFTTAWNAGDIARAKTLLSENFLCNGTLDREAFGELLNEGYADLAAAGVPAITCDLMEMTPQGGDVAAEFTLRLGRQGAEETGTQRVAMIFTLENERWVIKSWQRQEP
jgi:hypothetical protein